MKISYLILFAMNYLTFDSRSEKSSFSMLFFCKKSVQNAIDSVTGDHGPGTYLYHTGVNEAVKVT